MSNFRPLEVVDRDSQTQPHVVAKFKYIFLAGYPLTEI